jgi:hypothetical protein
VQQAVIAVMGAANRDPERFTEPDTAELADEVAAAYGYDATLTFRSLAR